MGTTNSIGTTIDSNRIDSRHDSARCEYKSRVVALHQSGDLSVLGAYKACYPDHFQEDDESDEDWLARCSEQDFLEGYDAAVLQWLYCEVCRAHGLPVE